MNYQQLKDALHNSLRLMGMSDVESFEITVSGVIYPIENDRKTPKRYEHTFIVSQSLLFHTSTPVLWKYLQQQIRIWHFGFVEEGEESTMDVDIDNVRFADSTPNVTAEHSRALYNLIHGADDDEVDELPRNPVELFRHTLKDCEIPDKDDSLLVTFLGTYMVELTEQADVYGISPEFRELHNTSQFELLLRVPTTLLTSDVATIFSDWVHWNIGVHLINMVASSPLYNTPVIHLLDGRLGPKLSELRWRPVVKLTGTGVHYGSHMPVASFIAALSNCVEYLLQEAAVLEENGKSTTVMIPPEPVDEQEMLNKGYVGAIDIEKLLCKELDREWSPTGISIVDLIQELGEKSRSGDY
jgi:hypothetical protein